MPRKSLKNVMNLLDNVNGNIAPEVGFLNDLKRSIELTADKNSRLPSKTYKPSSMNCIRNMYYQNIGADQDENKSSYVMEGIVRSGSDIHEYVQKNVELMKENGMDCEYVDVAEFVKSRNLVDIEIVSKQGMETKLYHKTLNMSFLCDGIIRYHGTYYILELKTETHYKWSTRKGVDPKHYNQATAYSIAFGINNVLFVYISRDILDMKSFMLNVTENMRKALLNKILVCNDYLLKKEVPPMPEEAGAKFCQYCAYKSRCKLDGGKDGI